VANVIYDDTHPQKVDFDNTNIQHSGRFRVPMIRTTGHPGVFLSSAINVFNMTIALVEVYIAFNEWMRVGIWG